MNVGRRLLIEGRGSPNVGQTARLPSQVGGDADPTKKKLLPASPAVPMLHAPCALPLFDEFRIRVDRFRIPISRRMDCEVEMSGRPLRIGIHSGPSDGPQLASL